MCNPQTSPFCEYKSTRFIRVRNPTLVVIYYTTILLVLVYIVVYTVYVQKGYQEFDQVIGTTSLKAKGTGSTIGYNNSIVYDAMDLVFPSTEQDALFITTAMTFTLNQTRGICNGNNDVQSCINDTDCIENTYDSNSQGIYTGICGDNLKCQVYSWCPLEDDENPITVNNIGNFTIFVKVDIEFPAFKISRTNALNHSNNNKPTDGYNLFSVEEIIGNATNGKNTTADFIKKGAIILVNSKWDCNLDKNSDECNPTFTFERIDGQKGSISTGYNFRTVDYYDNQSYRDLKKLIGIRIIFKTDGTGGKFSFSALSITFGAGLAYLGIASFITDVILERFLPESNVYDRLKYQHADDGSNLSEKQGVKHHTPYHKINDM